MRNAVPVLSVIAALLALWYAAVPLMNVQETLTAAERAGAVLDPPSALERREVGALPLALRNLGQLGQSWSMDRPRLPAPHQVAAELWASTWDEEVNGRRGIVQSGSFSNRSLVYHAGITLGATVVGLPDRRGARRPSRRRHRPFPGDGYERDALGDRQPDDPDRRARRR